MAKFRLCGASMGDLPVSLVLNLKKLKMSRAVLNWKKRKKLRRDKFRVFSFYLHWRAVCGSGERRCLSFQGEPLLVWVGVGVQLF